MRSALRLVIRVVLVLLLAGAGVAALLQWQKRQAHQLVLGQTASVITAVRDLARLETCEFHIERVVDLRDSQSRFYGLWEGEDALLLVAAGDVVAGIDLRTLKPQDVRVTADQVMLRLPAPQIFSTRLDESRTYVHTRRTDLLAARDERLEGRARSIAVDTFEDAARQSGILERARVQAERLIKSLVQPLAARPVVIEWARARRD